MDISILEDLGLTRAEIEAYLALLTLGSAHAGEIMRKSELQNSVLHRALNSLIDKGLINFIYQEKTRVYQATKPEYFLDFVDAKKERFKQILPELKRRQSHKEQSETATVYKGKRGVTDVYNQLVSNPDANEYLTFGGGKPCQECMGDSWWLNIHAKRVANKMPARQVFDESVKQIGKQIQKRKSQIRYLSKEFQQFQETVISGNLVAITVFSEQPYSFLINDANVAGGYKKYFEFIWQRASKESS